MTVIRFFASSVSIGSRRIPKIKPEVSSVESAENYCQTQLTTRHIGQMTGINDAVASSKMPEESEWKGKTVPHNPVTCVWTGASTIRKA